MQQEKQNRGGPKAYLKDFRKTADGSYQYYGKCFALQGCRESAFLLRSGIFSCGALLLTVLSGLLAGPGMDRTPYVLLPYVLLVGAAGSLVWAFFRLVFADRPLREYAYKGAVQCVPRRCVFTVISAALRIGGQIAYLAIHRAESGILYVVIDFALSVLLVVFVLLLFFFSRRADWREIPQPVPKE